jgi:hypothetical protein
MALIRRIRRASCTARRTGAVRLVLWLGAICAAASCKHAASCLIKSLQIITESLAGNKLGKGGLLKFWGFK